MILGRRGRDLELPPQFNGKDGVFHEHVNNSTRFVKHRFSGAIAALDVPLNRPLTFYLNHSEMRAEVDNGSGKLNIRCVLLFPDILNVRTLGRVSEVFASARGNSGA